MANTFLEIILFVCCFGHGFSTVTYGDVNSDTCGHVNGQASPSPEFHEFDFYKHNVHRIPEYQDMIPLPPSFWQPINQQCNVDEPVYDANIHLALAQPEYVSLLGDYSKVDPTDVPKVGGPDGLKSSKLAFTAPFQMLSTEGVRVVYNIIQQYKSHAHKNERNLEMRGLYYMSPFIRALVTCPIFLGHLAQFAGEPVWPHFLLSDSPSVNFGKPVDNIQNDPKVVDHWHFDSVAYVAVALVSDIEDMEGGELQIIKKPKHEAMELLKNTNNQVPEEDLHTVSYGRSGAVIFVQGSEMVHHVTQVKKANEPRLSLVMAFQPANVFMPDKTVFHTWDSIFDRASQVAPYEFFRAKAYSAGNALQSYMKNIPATKNRTELATLLRDVAAELDRSADLIDLSITDQIGYYREE